MIANRIRNRALAHSAIVLLAMLTTLVPKTSAQSAVASPTYAQPTLPGKGGAGPITDAPHNFADQAFVNPVLERDTGDFQLAQLAQDKTQSDDVKQLGQKVLANSDRTR
jgi:putative membrane protein